MPLEFGVILESLESDIQNAQNKIDVIENMFGIEINSESIDINVEENTPRGIDISRP